MVEQNQRLWQRGSWPWTRSFIFRINWLKLIIYCGQKITTITKWRNPKISPGSTPKQRECFVKYTKSCELHTLVVRTLSFVVALTQRRQTIHAPPKNCPKILRCAKDLVRKHLEEANTRTTDSLNNGFHVSFPLTQAMSVVPLGSSIKYSSSSTIVPSSSSCHWISVKPTFSGMPSNPFVRSEENNSSNVWTPVMFTFSLREQLTTLNFPTSDEAMMLGQQAPVATVLPNPNLRAQCLGRQHWVDISAAFLLPES